MSKQLNVDLRFNADVTAAKANIAALQQSLSTIANTNIPVGTKLTSSMQSAVQSAKELQFHLANAFNAKTGNLDLTMLNTSLKNSNQSLSTLTSGLLNAGIQGEQAFMNVQRAVSTASVQINQAQGLLGQFLTTLKNTARWQLSSTLLHGFMSSIQSANRYAQDLDESLNNIRIVTGQSSEQMAKFAEQANKSAKALRTTTVEYTNAALIYYQQGLNGQDVEQRADITAKLANVSRQSAEIVSDQMTAIWNNFYDGSKSLEYYADVLTALGATTASSTDEIAGGLEKFAAIGQTIGLSYEYAASALATITANTRQSEEVVGTALKTIFARIQGLKLGETLEDGTTLNKYSEALQTVGVNIYNANGGLKDMDKILDEMGAKWGALNRDQQTALAQTVAGVRQYNQLISLMDNWDKGDSDSFQANLQTSYDATGALQEQADIYAESWEAASDRVKAAFEGIYNDLIPTEGIIDATNIFATMLEAIDDIIEGFGGFSQILLLITSIMLNKLGPSIAQGFDSGIIKAKEFGNSIINFIPNSFQKITNSVSNFGKINNNEFMALSDHISQVADTTKTAAQQIDYFNNNLKSGAGSVLTQQQESIGKAVNGTVLLTDTFKTHLQDVSQVNNLQALINDSSNKLTASTKAQLSNYQQQLLALADKKAKEQETLEIIQAQKQALLDSSNFDYTNPRYSETYTGEGMVDSTRIEAAAMQSEKMAQIWANIHNEIFNANLGLVENAERTTFVAQGQNGIAEAAANSLSMYENIQTLNSRISDILSNQSISVSEKRKAMFQLIQTAKQEGAITAQQARDYNKSVYYLDETTNSAKKLIGFMRNLSDGAGRFAQSLGNSPDTLRQINGLVEKEIAAEKQRNATAQEYNNTLENTVKLLSTGIQNFSSGFGAAFQKMASGASTVAMGINSIVNAFQTLQDEDASFTSKLTATTMALTMGMSGLMTVLGGLNTVLTTVNATRTISTALTGLGTAATQKDIAATITETLVTKLNVDAERASVIAKTASEIASKKGTAAAIKYTLVQLGLNAALLPMIGIVAGIAAVIGLLVFAFKNAEANSPEGKLKAAREESAALTEQLNQTKQAAEDLKSGFDDYNQIAKKLADCKKGTQEWTDALKENNDKVLDLMDSYPKLASMTRETDKGIENAIGIGKDGQLIIADWAFKRLETEANQRQATAQLADNFGKQNVRNQEIENLETKKSQVENRGKVWVQTGAGQYSTEGYYTDGQVSKLSNELIKNLTNKYGVDKAQDFLTEEFFTNFKTENAELELTDYQWDSIYNRTNELLTIEQDLTNAVRENTLATQAENAAITNSLLSGYEAYDVSQYKGNIAQIIGNNISSEASQEQINSEIKNASTRGWFNTGNETSIDAWNRYVTNMGFTSKNGYNDLKVTNYKGDGSIEYSYIDAEGKTQTRTATANMIGTTNAASLTKEDNIAYGQAVSDQMSKFASQEQADIFTAGMLGSEGVLSDDLLEKDEQAFGDLVNQIDIADELLEDLGIESEEAFKQQIKDLQKSQKAFKKLETSYAGYITKVEQGLGENATAEQIAEAEAAAKSLGEELGEVFGTEAYDLDPQFIADNKGAIEDFMNGIEGSGERLQNLLAQDYLLDVGVNVDVDEDGKLDQAIADLHNKVMGFNNSETFKIGVPIEVQGNEKFYAACNEMINAAGMTADQAVEYFKKIGYNAEVEEVTVEPDKHEWSIDNPILDEEATEKAGVPIFKGMDKLKGTNLSGGGKALAVKTITPNGSWGGNVNTKASKINGNTTKDSPGTINPNGGGSKNTPKDKTFKEKDKKEAKLYEDEFDRYYNITQALEKYNRELEETQERKDELWGADKLAVMDAEKKKLGEITAKQKEYLKAISGSEDGTFKDGFLKTDMDALKQLDPDAKFDENGKLINYEELTQKWLKELNSAQEIWNTGMENATNTFNANKKSENANETYDNTKTALDDDLEKAEDIYEKRKAALDKWQETYDLNEDQKQQLEDYLRQMRQLNYEKLEYKIELKVELNENDIADIEHQLERLGDNNVYASAERIALIEKNAASYRNIAEIQMAAIKEAEQLYATGQITQTDYMARLQESKEALQEAEMSIREGIEQIGDELESTFDLVDEKLNQQFTKFDRLIELMDHYKNVVSLTEGEASYKEFNKILRASQEVLRDRIAADKFEVAMWENRRKQLEADIATLPKDSPAKREAEEALQAIMEKEADAKSQLMADIEQLGEYAREVFENSIEQAIKEFEDEMFGRPLNSIIESIEMMNSRQEELLTTTNKIYETNKLIRNVEKDIEATTNNRAKQAYLEFQNKVKQKQEQNELTKFELDLLTAEYEMTKAQIALEEAQNAKDTVRLTRDAEGNYGYVYTANEDKVTDAEQALDDATNNYYNTALEGAQKYQDQIYQHIQEWEEKVKEVYLDQTLSEEEKNKKIKEINDTYNTLITQDKNLYYMAIGAMQESAYNTQVDYDLKGIESAKNWFDECDGFLSDLEDAQDEYDRNTEEVSDHTEKNFGKMSIAIRKTKQESEYLKDQIVDELVPELDITLKDSIDNATEAWWKYIEALQEVIRLTDEAMKKNSDEKYYGTIDDFSQEIYDKISSREYNINDPEIQALIERRWKKMSGVDNYDYTTMMNETDKINDPVWQAVYSALREYKIDNTDWMAKIEDAIDSGKKLSDIQWMIDMRDEKLKKMNKTPDSLEQAKKYAESVNATLATGGYTGSWGPEGRLAVLHEKELVLNAQDTQNFLSATNILREISQMLDRDALIASLGAINLRAMTLNSPADQVLQQEVTIHADFPNVTDHNEIEIAIDNLINAASQHAYKA